MQSSFPQSNTPQIRRAGVDLNGVMSVLSKHLYSTPTVALRELVQNAHDSILRRRLEQPDWQGPSRIEVIGDSASNTVRIVDTAPGSPSTKSTPTWPPSASATPADCASPATRTAG